VSSFHDDNVRGFGLMQRDLRFDSYQDVMAKYEVRPSAWVVPDGDWGPGSVELVEIPSDEDLNDNIVAYWVPEKPVKANEPVEFGYRLSAYLKTDALSPIGRSLATRVGPAEPVNAEAEDRHHPHLFWVDFGGGDISSLQPDQPVEAKIDASTGTLRDVTARKLDNGTWRAAFVLSPDGNKDAELRGFLALRGTPLTETWTFRWSAE
jgi:glucans biosynthesis protein